MKSLFGTDGIRGEAGRFPLDAPTVNIIGFSLARYLGRATNKPPVVVIGRDTRESGAWLERALLEGASAAGAECHSAGVITTPGVAYLTRILKAGAGVVISASHNPYHDNGIKIFSPSGQKIDDSIEHLIEADVASPSWSGPSSSGETQIYSSLEGEEGLRATYLSFLANEIGAGLTLRDLTIVLDCANGASSVLAPALFEQLGARVIPINNTPDGRNINLNCGSLHIESLQQRVAAERADLGVAFDGDADRALFVDGHGSFVDGDSTLWILANHLKSQQRLKDDLVVATVMSNIGLEIALRSRGIDLLRTDVGDKYVLDALLERHASLGGEQSGHIILPDLSLAGDGMITSLCVVKAMRDSAKSLSELTASFEHYPQVLVNVRVREKAPFNELPAVQEAMERVQRQLSKNGRLLLRYSGTEPLARVMIEGEKQGEIDNYAEDIAGAIRHAIGA
jgi:phosphoglucosamine mutase